MTALIDTLVDAFLQWKLPDSVCSDLCATDRDYAKRYPGTRCGTNLLSADEARQMIEHVLAAAPALIADARALAAAKARVAELENSLDWFADENGDGAQRDAARLLNP